MPPGTSDAELDEVALALSDIVMVCPTALNHPLVKRARKLEKRIVERGEQLPVMGPLESVTQGLDPCLGGWRRPGRHVFGRIEQTILRVFELDWFGHRTKEPDRRWRRLREPLGLKWRPNSYFAPPDPLHASPDTKIENPESPLVTRFSAFDRSALFGSYIHRDQIWVTHTLAAIAVFAAIKAIVVKGDHHWAEWEFGLLFCIAVLVWLVQRFRLQAHWTACRLGAEQLRIARLCLPLLVVPRFLSSVDSAAGQRDSSEHAADLTLRTLAEVKRAVRDHGLPELIRDMTAKRAARWVWFMINDQIDYHEANYHRLETAENRLRWATNFVFLVVIGAVAMKIAHHAWACLPFFEAVPLVAAAGPAFAGALHGAATRLGIVQRIALSEVALRDLRPIRDELADIIGKPDDDDLERDIAHWTRLRGLTLRAAEVMGQENTSWHGQVRLQREGLPA